MSITNFFFKQAKVSHSNNKMKLANDACQQTQSKIITCMCFIVFAVCVRERERERERERDQRQTDQRQMNQR